MLASGIPVKFNIPWANSAGGSFIRGIPQASQIGTQAGAASLTDGFPPVTFSPIGAGGTPPFGQDFNGILKQITQWSQWFSVGGPIPFDAAFSTAIGGYPKGALIASAVFGNYWLCTADNNTTNPDSGGANWTAITRTTPTRQLFSTPGSATYTTPAFCRQLRIRMVGGGGGGGANGGAGLGGAGAGTATVFNAIGAAGGAAGSGTGGQPGGPGGTGGNGGVGSASFRSAGQNGGTGISSNVNFFTAGAGTGGASLLGFGGVLASQSGVGPGGGGAGSGAASNTFGNGGGGGGGEYVELIINSPAATYSYTVGSGGTGGAGGSGGSTAGTGNGGEIIVEEIY